MYVHSLVTVFAVLESYKFAHTVDPENDAFVNLADDALKWLAKSAIPGTYWVDYVPLGILNHIFEDVSLM